MHYALIEVVPETSPDNQPTKPQQMDFANNWKFPCIPDQSVDINYGEPMTIMLNLKKK